MFPEPLILFSGLMLCAALGYFLAARIYTLRLRRIEKDTWAIASHFYTAKAKE